ncbi:GntR family transcriptional regulator [Cellulomonas sp. NPDC089187]|uniref:GntR family transcriptional regulator n=1 Tax=Cellulomonas sp. NPDC089187 TaxID=3154970 RepID=UPI00343DB08E
MLFRIDPTAEEPLFEQLAGQIRAAVIRGELSPGDRLPAARDLAASLEINLHTVLHAYQDLRDEGLLEVRRGRGAVVAEHQAGDFTRLRTALDDLVAAAQDLGLAAGTTVGLVREALAGTERR